MKTARTVLAALILAAPIALAASPALAAAPTNDLLAGATPVSLGFSETLDTTEATTDADDAQANASCGAPATDASVWYSYTAAADGGAVVDTSSSSYSSGILVATGGPGSLSTITCGPGGVVFGTTAGTTYSILVFDFQGDGIGNGGVLNISLAGLPDPPTIAVTVDPTGVVNARTGTATLTGTITCTDADFAVTFGELTQRVGRGTVNGFFELFSEAPCDGTAQAWTADVPALNGKFAGGKSAAVTFSFACGAFQCADGFTEQAVQLRGGKK